MGFQIIKLVRDSYSKIAPVFSFTSSLYLLLFLPTILAFNFEKNNKKFLILIPLSQYWGSIRQSITLAIILESIHKETQHIAKTFDQSQRTPSTFCQLKLQIQIKYLNFNQTTVENVFLIQWEKLIEKLSLSDFDIHRLFSLKNSSKEGKSYSKVRITDSKIKGWKRTKRRVVSDTKKRKWSRKICQYSKAI